jgi:hypothetical protein
LIAVLHGLQSETLVLPPFTVGSGIVGLLLWATRLQQAPKMEPALWKALAPVALFHTLG